MKTQKTKINGFINESHTNEVAEVFNQAIADQLANSEGKTFLQILVENGQFDLTKTAN